MFPITCPGLGLRLTGIATAMPVQHPSLCWMSNKRLRAAHPTG